jgi:hypothetical protein
MIQKENNLKSGNEEPLRAYIQLPEDSENEEVNLWLFFLTLLKYKLQIALFLLIGLIIGLAVPWFEHMTNQSNVDILAPAPDLAEGSLEKLLSNFRQDYQARLTEYLKEKSDYLNKIYQRIDEIPEGKQILELKGAEYHYTVLDNLGKLIIIKTNLSIVLDPVVRKAPPRDYQIVYNIAKTTTFSLKNRLKKAYKGLEEIDNEILLLDLKNRKKRLLQVLVEKESTHIPNLEGKTKEQKLSVLSKELAMLKSKIDFLKEEHKKREFQKNLIQQTLAYQIPFDVPQKKKIPANLWHKLGEVPNAGNVGYRYRTNEINKLYLSNRKADQVIQKLKMIDYILNSRVDLHEIDLPSVKELLQLKKGRTTKKKNKTHRKKDNAIYTITNRFLVESLVIAFFIGLFSVYIRFIVVKIKEENTFEKYKSEFMEALKYWKI